MLYILRGLPGSGKTTFANTMAQALGAPLFAADDYFTDADGNYRWNPSLLFEAHQECQEKVHAALLSNKNVIVHNTCCRESDVQDYLSIANECNHDATVLVVEHRHSNSSVHGVIPQKTIERMSSQLRNSIKLITDAKFSIPRALASSSEL